MAYGCRYRNPHYLPIAAVSKSLWAKNLRQRYRRREQVSIHSGKWGNKISRKFTFGSNGGSQGGAVGHADHRPRHVRVQRPQLAANERALFVIDRRPAVELVVHHVQIIALQVAAVGVDFRRGGRPVHFAPVAFAHVGEEIHGAIGLVAVYRLLFDQAGEAGRVHQLRQDHLLRRPDAGERAVRFDAAQDFGVEHPGWRGEDVVVQEPHRLDLSLFRDWREEHAVLSDVFLLSVEAADDSRDVAHLQPPLSDHRVVNLLEVVVRLALLVLGRGEQHVGDALEVLQPERRSLDRVGVAHGLCQFARVGAARPEGREAIPRRLVLLARPLVERLLFVFGRLASVNRLVAPHRGPLVVRADLRDQQIDWDVVFGLRDVIEARVVHDRWRVAVFFEPFRVADFLERVHRTALHVVLESERVADLVRDDEAQQFAHQVVGQRQFLRARVERPHLREVPVALEVQDVVVHLNVRLEYLAGARVVNVGPGRVHNRRGQPAHDRITRVFGLQSGSSFGASFAMMAFLNPAASNAGCQSSTPFFSQDTHLLGVAGSIQYTIGFTGSESAADGSFLSRRYFTT